MKHNNTPIYPGYMESNLDWVPIWEKDLPTTIEEVKRVQYNKRVNKQKKKVKIPEDQKLQSNVEMCGTIYSKYYGNISNISDTKKVMYEEMLGYRKKYWFLNDKEFRKYTQVRYLNKYLIHVVDNIEKSSIKNIEPFLLNKRTLRILVENGIKNIGDIVEQNNNEKYHLLRLTNLYNKIISRKEEENMEIYYTEIKDYKYTLRYKKFTYEIDKNQIDYKHEKIILYIENEENLVVNINCKVGYRLPRYIELSYTEKEKVNDLMLIDKYPMSNFLMRQLDEYLNKFYHEYLYK